MGLNAAEGGYFGVQCNPQSIYVESETPMATLGETLRLRDGRVFKYAKCGSSTALTPGKVVQSAVLMGGTTALLDEVVIATSVAAGANQVSATAPTDNPLTANQLAEGFLIVDNGTNVGFMARIKSNTAAAAAANSTITIYGYFTEALTAGTEKLALYNNVYSDIVIHDSIPTGCVLGVPLIDVTASYYFWLQTAGPALALAGGTWACAKKLVADTSTDGALIVAADGATELHRGVAEAFGATASGDYGLCMLTCAW